MGKPITRLEALPGEAMVEELSVVPRGAQRQMFLLTKELGMDIEKLVDTIVDGKVEKAEELEALLEKADLSDEQATAVRGALRLLASVGDAVPRDVMEKVAALVQPKQEEGEGEEEEYGEPPAEKGEGEEYEEPEKTAKEDQETEDDTVKPIQKEDGSWDITQLPEEFQAYVSGLTKTADEKDERLAKLEKSHGELIDEIRTAEFVKKAGASFAHLGKASELGTILKQLHDVDTELAGKVEALLAKAETAVARGDLFEAVGTGRGEGGHGTAWGEIEELAKQLRKSDSSLTKPASISRVLEQHPDLGARYRKESRGR